MGNKSALQLEVEKEMGFEIDEDLFAYLEHYARRKTGSRQQKRRPRLGRRRLRRRIPFTSDPRRDPRNGLFCLL